MTATVPPKEGDRRRDASPLSKRRPRPRLTLPKAWKLPPIESIESLIRVHTGEVISEEAFQRRQQAERAYRERLELALRACDSEARVGTQMESNELWWVGLFSGHAQKVIKATRRMVFPEYASKTRDDTLSALAFYLTRNPGCRHVVITGGKRVPFQQVRSVLRGLMDRTRRLKDRQWFSRVAEVIMRSAEVTCKDGLFHCHLHIVIRPVVPLNECDWIEIRADLNACFDTVVEDFGPVANPHAIARYLFKGSTIDESDPLAVGALVDLLKGVRTHEPQGEFRELCRELQRTNTKFKYCGDRLVRVDRSDGSRKPSLRNLDGETRASGGQRGPQQPKAPPQNFLLRVSHPVARATRVKEPYLLILNYKGSLNEFLEDNPKFAKLRQELMPKWSAGVAAAGGNPVVPVEQGSDRQPAPVAQSPHKSASQSATSTAHGSIEDLIAKDDLEMVGFDPADFFWRPPKGGSQGQPAWTSDETSFPL